MRKKIRLGAVLDADFNRFLDSLGILEDIESGAVECSICGEPVAAENVYCVYTSEGKIKVCCDRSQCYSALVKHKAGETNA